MTRPGRLLDARLRIMVPARSSTEPRRRASGARSGGISERNSGGPRAKLQGGRLAAHVRAPGLRCLVAAAGVRPRGRARSTWRPGFAELGALRSRGPSSPDDWFTQEPRRILRLGGPASCELREEVHGRELRLSWKRDFGRSFGRTRRAAWMDVALGRKTESRLRPGARKGGADRPTRCASGTTCRPAAGTGSMRTWPRLLRDELRPVIAEYEEIKRTRRPARLRRPAHSDSRNLLRDDHEIRAHYQRPIHPRVHR